MARPVNAIDWAGFAAEVKTRLATMGWTGRGAVRAWPELNAALISRAANGEVLSAGNYLQLCRRFGIDPYAHLDVQLPAAMPEARETAAPTSLKTILDQAVTRAVSREAPFASRDASEASPPVAPAGRATTRGVRSNALGAQSSTEAT